MSSKYRKIVRLRKSRDRGLGNYVSSEHWETLLHIQLHPIIFTGCFYLFFSRKHQKDRISPSVSKARIGGTERELMVSLRRGGRGSTFQRKRREGGESTQASKATTLLSHPSSAIYNRVCMREGDGENTT